jgi:hypothetical protein
MSLNKLVKFPKVGNALDSAVFLFAMMHKGDSHLDLSVERSNVTETLKLVFEDLLMMFRYWYSRQQNSLVLGELSCWKNIPVCH